METPESLRYTKTHQWIHTLDDGAVEIGLTNFAVSTLGGIVYIELPSAGQILECGKAYAEIESSKTVLELIAPVSGIVGAVNKALINTPELLNNCPYQTWILRTAGGPGSSPDRENTLSSSEYRAFAGI